MWNLILSFLGGPIVNGILSGYKSYLGSVDTIEAAKVDLAKRELDVESIEAQARGQLRIAQVGHWSEPEHLMGYILVAYIGKVVVWDTMLGLGSTGSIHGDVGTWLGMIAAFYLGGRTITSVARIMKG